MQIVLVALLSGIGTGSIYALTALGLTLVLASSGVLNMAQSSVVMGGALATYGLYTLYHWPILAVLAVMLGTGGFAGLASYFIAVGTVFNRPGITDNLTEGTLVTTLGLSLVFNSIMALAFGLDVYPVKSYAGSAPYKVGDVPVQPIYVVMFLVTVAIVVAVELFVRHTSSGLYLRMTFEDPEGAGLEGTSVVKVVLVSFAVAGALAAIAGALIVPVTSASSQLANSFGLYGFAGMAIGGYGSFQGALAGGLFVGIVNALVPVWLNVDLAPAIIYALLILVLMFRPQGMLGKMGAFGASKVREI